MSALSGIDIALWDLKGNITIKWTVVFFISYLYFLDKVLHACEINIDWLLGRKLGVPIYELLGGKVRHKIKVYAWIGGDRPDEVEKQA